MTVFDYSILLIYLSAILAMGWYLRINDGKHENFFLAGRKMGWFPIGLSVMVTVFSAINYVALPNEVFGYGLYVIVALPVFFISALPITKIWMPFFHEMRLTSVYEYLEHRFDCRVRSLASGIFIIWRLFWMATALYASSQIMSVLTGIPAPTIIIVGGSVASVYTFLGGIRAVMWTDVIQFFVLFGGIALGVFFSAGDGGISEILSIAHKAGKLKPFMPFDPSFLSLNPTLRMTLWSGLIGVFVAFISRYGADQVVMQRYFTARNLKTAQRGLWLNAAVAVISLSLLAFFGLAVYAYAVKNGNLPAVSWELIAPLQRKGIAMKQLAAVIRSFPPGVTGLVIAGLMAATMSSIDSGINACSAAYVTDFHNRLFIKTKNSKAMTLKLDRMLTLSFGAASTLLALALIPMVGKTNSLFMIVNKLINSMGSPLLAIFLLGMFSKSVNSPGMFIGGIIALLSSVSISLFVKPLALQYYAVANLIASIVSCLFISRIASLCGYIQNPKSLSWTWRARKRRIT